MRSLVQLVSNQWKWWTRDRITDQEPTESLFDKTRREQQKPEYVHKVIAENNKKPDFKPREVQDRFESMEHRRFHEMLKKELL